MKIFAVRYDYVPDEAGLDRERQAHRDYLRGLAAKGEMAASGPFGADGGTRGALILLRGESAEAVRKTLASDPFATAGLIAKTDIREWLVLSGPAAEAIKEAR